MSTKSLFKIMIAFGLVVVVFLAVQTEFRTSALSLAKGEAMITRSLAGSDWIERHPSNYYAGSDWIERHPVSLRLNKYIGSDWIERHPSPTVDAAAYAGSDWIERHPSKYYTGSDWIERHSNQLSR